jgi:hypothetical protein
MYTSRQKTTHNYQQIVAEPRERKYMKHMQTLITKQHKAETGCLVGAGS